MVSRYASTDAHHDDTDRAAKDLYDAEVHLHAAHQSKVDEWIRVAADHLHEAILRYDELIAAASFAATPLAA